MSTYLVTGGAGFIGSHFCKMALKNGWCDRLVNLDSLTYAGNLDNLSELKDNPAYEFEQLDLTGARVTELVTKVDPDVILHFAAESHVDRSIEDPALFLRTNILGTFELLNGMQSLQKKCRFLMVSTDEVYGSLGLEGQFHETTAFSPRSPYSVSKASADMLSMAYFHTYGSDVVVVRCSNNYGPNQFPEKLIPQTIIRALREKSIPVYGTGENVRDWIFVEDFARGIQAAVSRGLAGEAYNFGGQAEEQNISVVQQILEQLKKPKSLIEFVTDRKGHDFRYAMNFEKATKDLGWQPKVSFQEGLEKTVNWYVENQQWIERVESGAYREFFDRYYSKSLNQL